MKLLPCPFCGRAADLASISASYPDGLVHCTGGDDCYLSDIWMLPSEWNRRAPSREGAAVALHRANMELTDDGLRICKGDHHRSQDCEWEYFVPKSMTADVIAIAWHAAIMEEWHRHPAFDTEAIERRAQELMDAHPR